MPIYEYYCPDNHRIYTFFARTLADGTRTPRCPDNPAFRMERLISKVSILRRSAKAGPGGDEGDAEAEDPRMEQALAEMEREFGSMDEENPDPRALGRMMRRMAELSGQGMPAAFEEMTRRLEAGEDPEKLESEYGDALDALDREPDGGGPAAAEAKPGGNLRRYLPPRRDPTLYELRDFLG